ncbi:MaoC family dehydratase [Plastoroseomonas hellenica]|uniref:MaoC family dehydratase n=1 Tax=Plastoroseomonas hellenica TaxID=2687306 RepID=UPI001BA783B6|nr:MaoC family dehydratase [Plastoroseomonas hellenica]MBR0647128.1 MaoC family dehydratase [Plastoroseomonas hellenica]
MASQQRLFLEDLAEGMRFAAGPVPIEAEEIKGFAARYDPQPFHLDEAAARGSLFGGLAASGWHTAALTMRLLTEALPFAQGVIGTGGEINWPRPTRPGDRLRVECEVLAVQPSRSRPADGWVSLRTTTLNQADEAVQVLTARLLVPRRPAAAGSGQGPGA